METIGLFFSELPLWAQVVILAVLLLPALIRVVEAFLKALLPRELRPSLPHPFYRELGSYQRHALRKQTRRRLVRSVRDGIRR